MMNFRRKNKIFVKNEIIISPVSLNHGKYLERTRNNVNPNEWHLFDNVISRMNGFPRDWLEGIDGKLYCADGLTRKEKSKYKKVKEGFQQRNFVILPTYLKAFSNLHDEAMKKENIGDLYPLMRYPLVYDRSREIIYEMDLFKRKLEQPLMEDNKYVSVFSRYAEEKIEGPLRDEMRSA